jgi:cbb3-type cytochrome oxidase maturation protein
MSVIYILIPVAVLFTAIGIYLFFWAVKTDQFEDLEKQGLSILFDDNEPTNSTKQPQTNVEILANKEENKNQPSSNSKN